MANENAKSPQEETIRLLALLIRLLLPTQTAAIVELNRAGFSATRIAELLGTSTNTANVTIQKAKKKPAKRQQVKLAATQASEPEEEE